MKITKRPYQVEDDYWRMREFLRQVTILNQRRWPSWHVSRLDYWWWFANPFLERIKPEENIFLWETETGEIAAVLNPERQGQVFLQIHPHYRKPELEEELIETAEKNLFTTSNENRKSLCVWLDSHEKSIQRILSRLGFRCVDEPGQQEVQHRRSLDEPLPEVQPVPGYIIRSLGDGLELLERCYASGLGFHNDDINTARQNRDKPDWYRGIQSAPLYRRDLDLVAVAPDGSIASFCTIWFDDVSRTACFEPVATVPAHRRHGLAGAVILEGLHRLKRMGCKVAFVSGFSQAANALYASVMGPEHDVSQPWKKVLD